MTRILLYTHKISKRNISDGSSLEQPWPVLLCQSIYLPKNVTSRPSRGIPFAEAKTISTTNDFKERMSTNSKLVCWAETHWTAWTHGHLSEATVRSLQKMRNSSFVLLCYNFLHFSFWNVCTKLFLLAAVHSPHEITQMMCCLLFPGFAPQETGYFKLKVIFLPGHRRW